MQYAWWRLEWPRQAGYRQYRWDEVSGVLTVRRWHGPAAVVQVHSPSLQSLERLKAAIRRYGWDEARETPTGWYVGVATKK